MLFSGTDLARVTSAYSDTSATKNKLENKKPFMRVTLLRQTSVVIRGTNWSNSILGEGTIWPIPPDLSSCDATCRASEGHEGNIDWDGEVRCRSNVSAGGFDAPNLRVKVGFSLHWQSSVWTLMSYYLGLYHSIHFPTHTNISPTGTKTHCSCQIGYRLFLRYYYTNGFCCHMSAPFSHCHYFCLIRDRHFSHVTS